MPDLSPYSRDHLADHLLGTATFTKPTAVYVGLFVAGVEVSGGAYARRAATFTASSGGATSNTATITFPEATGSWGTIDSAQLFDASTGGNALTVIKALAATKTIGTGDLFEIVAGTLTFSLS